MQAELAIKCQGCRKVIGKVLIDTADLPGELQAKINKVILAHRSDCAYYNESVTN